MIYNRDVAHCSRYLCLLNEKCYRYWLFRQWESKEEKEPAPFISARYDMNKNKCKDFKKLEL